jgi:hypothetical protein
MSNFKVFSDIYISVSRQRLFKHVPTPTDPHATIEILLETVFFTRSVQMGYKDDI